MKGCLFPRAITPCHDPFVAKDIRHKMNLDPKAPAMQKNWGGIIWGNQWSVLYS